MDHRFSDLVWERGIPELYSIRKGVDLRQAERHIKEEYDKVGENNLEWYDIRYWFKRFDLGDLWERLLNSYKDEIRIYPEVLDVLGRLYKKYELIIVSNSAREFMDLQIKQIKNYFTRIFSTTSDFKEVKKTTNLYSKICGILGVRPDEMAHIGDHWTFDFVIPRKLGITAFYLDRTGKEVGEFVVKDLKEFEKKLSQ